MKIVFSLIILLIIIGLLAIGFSKLPNSSDNQSAYTQKQFEEIEDEVNNKAASLYDVRTPEEYATGKFVGSINLPLQDMQNGKLPELDKTSKIYIYCRSGNRSAQALKLLTEAGYLNVTDLGGIEDVKKIGGKLN